HAVGIDLRTRPDGGDSGPQRADAVRSARMTAELVKVTVDGTEVEVPAGVTLLQAITRAGVSTPTLCYDPVMRPVNDCRVCVVELKGARALVPACSRAVENDMDVLTDSPRVRQARRVVLELLQSSVDTSTAPDLQRFATEYGAQPQRFGEAERVNQPVRA